jgi:hypothetical protein
MGKKHRSKKATPNHYFKGASWRDVLAGRPVCREDLSNVGERRKVNFKCRDCKKKAWLWNTIGLMDKANRCYGCGGILEVVLPKKKETA